MKRASLCLLLVACAAPRKAPARVLPAGGVELLAQPVDGFYAKRLMDGRIAILAHATVSDDALLAARERLERLIAHAPKLRANLEAARYQLHLSGLGQYTSDLPEFRGERGTRLESGELFDWHMIGGHLSARSSSCTEATLLPVVGHRLYGDDTCLHELAHAIEWIALDAQNRARVAHEYERSIGAGHWKDQYAAKNAHEWFAEITKLYFRSAIEADFYNPSLSRRREWLCGYDPDACALVRELYSGAIDPGTLQIVELRTRPGRDEATLRSAPSATPTRFWVRNRAHLPLRIVWIDFNGARDTRREFVSQPALAPGAERMVITFAGHAWMVTDVEGRALCTFVTQESDGLVEITGACE